ncbi:methionyl-tRNA formyltransferase [Prochlorococcus sp. MIT 1307]|uniref:methionyl-tRNA formyltransferase n=1 Tax=Prochlorococcus sp. MIT 1307 TaxID=3096219 RepID=UPI002A74D29A|nr:methionyl-tRNA formyltransferase [Prochlorococcus sp. MIT 1307]
MKIIFWGTPNYAAESLYSLIQSEHKVIAVVTQPDKRRNRGSRTTASPVKQKAMENNIKVFSPYNIKKQQNIQEEIANLKADIYIVVAFGQILPIEVLNQPRFGCWNSHASLLPRWRGAGPIQWSLISGDKSTGVAIMFMEEGLDTGPVLFQSEINIGLLDNAQVLTNKLSKLSSNLLLKTLNIIENNTKSEPYGIPKLLDLTLQEDIQIKPTYARLLSKSDSLINWNTSALDIHRLVMGVFPNSYTFVQSKRLKIMATIPLLNIAKDYFSKFVDPLMINTLPKDSKPGSIIYLYKDVGLIVSTAESYLLITEAQLEGKKPVRGNSLIQQLGLNVGESFN